MSFVTRLILLLAANIAALWVADVLVSGFSIDHIWPTLVIAGLVLGVLDFFVKPIMKLLALPFIILTLGLVLIVINAVILGLMTLLVPGVSLSGILPAIWAALIISIVNWILISALGLRD
jgi:putative membrane protein